MPPAAIPLRPSALERAARLLRRALAALGDPFLAERLARLPRRAGPTAVAVGGAAHAEAIGAALARLAALGPRGPGLSMRSVGHGDPDGAGAAYSPQPSRRRASRATRSWANSSSSCWRPARDIETSVSWSWRNGHIASSWSMLWRRNRSASVRAR